MMSRDVKDLLTIAARIDRYTWRDSDGDRLGMGSYTDEREKHIKIVLKFLREELTS